MVAGVAVVLAARLARRADLWGGIVAAAPVTPTFALILLAQAGEPLLLASGLTSIAATLIVLSVSAGRVGAGLRVPRALWIVALVPPLVWFMARWVPTPLVIVVLLAAAVVASVRTRILPGKTAVFDTSRRRRASGPLRFIFGAASVFLVAVTVHALPGLAPMVALFPLVFTAGLFMAEWDGGRIAADRVAAGGVPGSIGVAAFALATSLLVPIGVSSLPLLLAAGWAAFILAGGAWVAVPALFPPRPRRRVPALAAALARRDAGVAAREGRVPSHA